MNIHLLKVMSIVYWGSYVGVYWLMSFIYFILDCLSERYPKIKSWKIQSEKKIYY
jgi:hypothetical protein